MKAQPLATRMLAGIVILASASAKQPEPADKNVSAAVRANSEFAVDLYQAISRGRPDTNLFFSPFSVSGALAIAAEGARDETAAEMNRVLHFPTDTTAMKAGIAELNRIINDKQELTPEGKLLRLQIKRLEKELEEERAAMKARQENQEDQEEEIRKRTFGRQPLSVREGEIVNRLNSLTRQLGGYELEMANALWGERSFPFHPDYQDAIEHSHGPDALQAADFINAADAERVRINQWVAGRTKNKIPNLLGRGSVDAESRLVITNAVYFRGTWVRPFREESTKQLTFFQAPGKSIKRPTMFAPSHSSARYGAFEADGTWFATPHRYQEGTEPKTYPDAKGFHMLELPYQGNHLSIIVLAPIEIDGLAAIEKAMTGEKLQAWIGKLQTRKTHVYLPKFKASANYRLIGSLRSLGMERAFKDPFTPGGADFSAMTRTPEVEGLAISDVLHRATISVNEKGTEAYSATYLHSMGFFASSAGRGPRFIDFTPTFRADRPFLFLIRDKRTSSILFLGRISKP